MSDTKLFNMRFTGKDIPLHQEALRLASKRRMSLAELIRRLLIEEVEKAKQLGELSEETKH